MLEKVMLEKVTGTFSTGAVQSLKGKTHEHDASSFFGGLVCF